MMRSEIGLLWCNNLGSNCWWCFRYCKAISGGISGGWEGALDGACLGFMSGTLIGGVAGTASVGLNIATGFTTVVGKAHGSNLHKLATNMEAGKMAASG